MYKKRLLLGSAILVILCVMVLAGCTEKKLETADVSSSGSSLRNEMIRNGSIKPGAKIDEYVDANGNKGITYVNPDGSGGGGVVID